MYVHGRCVWSQNDELVFLFLCDSIIFALVLSLRAVRSLCLCRSFAVSWEWRGGQNMKGHGSNSSNFSKEVYADVLLVLREIRVNQINTLPTK